MIVKILGADARATAGIGVVAPTKDAGVRDVIRQEIAKPVNVIIGGPSPVAVAIEAMYGNNAEEE